MLSQIWPRNAPHIWVTYKKFLDSLNTTTSICPKTFHGLWDFCSFVPIDSVNMHTKFAVRSFTCSWVNSGEPKNSERSLAMTTLYSPINPIRLSCRLCICTCFHDFRLAFWVGVAKLQAREKGGRRGSGMVSFERALASYIGRPQFPLSLGVAAFVLQNATFSLPHFVCSLKFPHVPLWIGG